ncbi:WxL domain-containing protein [Enterococcus rotai]|uniref:WxL domain-containing protein n=1 Tax=Enterococcus rotai TaxID=118060 RepID=UPI0035C6EEAA
MKLTHKLAGTALLAAIAVAATAPGVTKAADPAAPGVGEGEIEFTSKTYGTYDTSGVVPPNYTSQSTIDTDSTALLDGPFLVQGMSKLVFNSQSATTGAVTSWAKPTTANANTVGATDKVEGRANWVQFKDDRQVDDHGYELKAIISQNFQFNDTAKGKIRNIKGAQITYGNAHLVADKDNESLKPTSGIVPAATVNETNSEIVFKNREETKGRGRYAVYFGDAEATKPTEKPEESVKLDLPANQAEEIMNGKYVAKITWTLEATPK